ncbi:hypothetical protein [Sulfuricurvum sp.]|uniref:hypothetical protein n=1 Tax=Sulfuricurvum sp. TaxID=2025608 RepID=UPI002D2B758F|nr:hypothetical protein [Sulfuricurvum sp.]HZF69387.1 hypothetical protein [Sulfuricurvum sp.]
MDVLKFFNIGEKVCIGLTGKKVFKIIGIQHPLPLFGGADTPHRIRKNASGSFTP